MTRIAFQRREITVEEAKAIETILEVVEGMQFDGGYLSPYFVTDPEKIALKVILVEKHTPTSNNDHLFEDPLA